MEKELRDQKVEHQLLLQCSWEVRRHVRRRCSLQMLTWSLLQLERERDELLRRQEDAALELQQALDLREQQLRRKTVVLRETLERREAQLYAALSTCDPDPGAAREASRKLQVPHPVGPHPWGHPLTGLVLISGPAGVQRSHPGGPAEGAELRLEDPHQEAPTPTGRGEGGGRGPAVFAAPCWLRT